MRCSWCESVKSGALMGIPKEATDARRYRVFSTSRVSNHHMGSTGTIASDRVVARQAQRSSTCSRRPGRFVAQCAVSSFHGHALRRSSSNGSIKRWRMATWLENKASVDVPLPLEPCWVLWEDRERIPQWMPWIKSVKIQEADSRLSRWTLSTHQFGRDWEFSWLARNLAPIKGQKIYWVSEPGSASLPGVEIANKGQIRFVRKGPQLTNITLTISYEVPDVLVPFGNAVTPLVENIISKDMQRFKEYATNFQQNKVSSGASTVNATTQGQ